MKVIGFTGTRHGMNADQLAYVTDLVRGLHADGLGVKTVHHGDCVGADAEFHNIVRTIDPKIRIEAHPCNLDRYRAYCQADTIYAVKPPLSRNVDIVQAADYLIAVPREKKRVSMSGTWWTMGKAEESKVQLFHVPPDIGDWRSIKSAPKDATILRVRMADKTEQFAHWAEDLSGSEQPIFSGWFANRGTSGFYEINQPKEWRPLTEEERDHPDVRSSWKVTR